MYGTLRRNRRIVSAWLAKQKENLTFRCSFDNDNYRIRRIQPYVSALGNCFATVGQLHYRNNDANCLRGAFLLQLARCQFECMQILCNVFTCHHVQAKQHVDLADLGQLNLLRICVCSRASCIFCFFSFCLHVSYSCGSIACLSLFRKP